MTEESVIKKACSKCKAVKPLNSFYRNRSMKDGHAYECKKCADSRLRNEYWKTEKGRAADRARYLLRISTPGGREALNERSRKYKQSDKGKFVAWARYLMKNYGIRVEDYERLLEQQGGGCAVCGTMPSPGRRLHVDHDHATGRVRGILCGKCNQAIGLLNEDRRLFELAKQYLDLWQVRLMNLG